MLGGALAASIGARSSWADAVRLAYLLTGDRYLAEDLAQDAFVRSFGRFQDLREHMKGDDGE